MITQLIWKIRNHSFVWMISLHHIRRSLLYRCGVDVVWCIKASSYHIEADKIRSVILYKFWLLSIVVACNSNTTKHYSPSTCVPLSYLVVCNIATMKIRRLISVRKKIGGKSQAVKIRTSIRLKKKLKKKSHLFLKKRYSCPVAIFFSS